MTLKMKDISEKKNYLINSYNDLIPYSKKEII